MGLWGRGRLARATGRCWSQALHQVSVFAHNRSFPWKLRGQTGPLRKACRVSTTMRGTWAGRSHTRSRGGRRCTKSRVRTSTLRLGVERAAHHSRLPGDHRLRFPGRLPAIRNVPRFLRHLRCHRRPRAAAKRLETTAPTAVARAAERSSGHPAVAPVDGHDTRGTAAERRGMTVARRQTVCSIARR